jgi:thiol:disulfide interchange protein DsbC
MKARRRLVQSISALALSTAAQAAPDEDKLLLDLKRALPGTQVSSVARTPIPGLYEVWMGDTVAFVSNSDVRYFVFGRLFDTHTMQDLTAPKLAKVEARHAADDSPAVHATVNVDQLPIADAIETVRGNGNHRIYVFSDPGCPYCRRLEPELAKLDNVTIYTFVVPFQGETLPLGIVCAAEPAKAWHALMLNGDPSLLGKPAGCSHALERNVALARQLRVAGTPTLIFADGSRISGYVSADQIAARLGALSTARAPEQAASGKERP